MNECSCERHNLVKIVSRACAACLIMFLSACRDPETSSPTVPNNTGNPTSDEGTLISEWKTLTADQWASRLTDDEYYVTREKGTEPPFSGEYWKTKTKGRYHCVCCDAPLFDSDSKFESGTGWPSFFQATDPGAVEEHEDRSLGIPRTEVTCRRCSAHLGHVFDDGPEPTGQRYCMNSTALRLRPRRLPSPEK